MSDEKSKLDALKQSLYRRGQKPQEPRGWSRFSSSREEEQEEQPSDWEHDHQQMAEVALRKRNTRVSSLGMPMKLFIFSVIFFVLALGVASFIILRGDNILSSENIDLVVTGPVLVGGGEVLTLQIDITNRNNASLEGVDLIVEFPEGARDPDNPDTSLQRTRESVGDLGPGERTSRTVSVLLFGEENKEEEISVGIEYRVADSNAIFFKEKAFDVRIGTAPISLLVSMPTEINSGESIDAVVEVISNSEETIKNVALFAEYPFGFSFTEGQPEPDVDTSLWMFGDLEPQGRRTINIRGTIEGQNQEERTFRFTGGLVEALNAREIDTVLLIAKRSLSIQRPFVQADLTLDGRTDDVHIADPNKTVSGNIHWQNNLTIPVEDVVVTVAFVGDILDETSVNALGGFYKSIDNTIVWDKALNPGLATVDPGDSGNLSFNFRVLDPAAALFKNGTLDVVVTISGNRIGNTPETTGEISSTVRKTVQLTSNTVVTSEAVYSTGPFNNTGPIPPRADEQTTYTVTWSLSNTSNNLADARISAALPSYVQFISGTSPSSEAVSFNPATGLVQWDLGAVSSGVGYTSPPREVSFQIMLQPSVSQVGSTPTLMGPATLSAHDTFTDTTVTAVSKELTTMIVTDPAYNVGDGRVEP